ncbi:hypothetical protein [Lacticaseibacillus hegangensis]|uniref:Uncharacterized protein n=1 Tax=Lacticaseibacillus hegangensis TaxID=2486010 RepID=A0ABW4CWI9_9LACO|nr:hypothetical protein [Lacticaseibacillus hegangensis]
MPKLHFNPAKILLGCSGLAIPISALLTLPTIVPWQVFPIADASAEKDLMTWQLFPRLGTFFFVMFILSVVVFSLGLLLRRAILGKVIGALALLLALGVSGLAYQHLTQFSGKVTALNLSGNPRDSVIDVQITTGYFKGKHLLLDDPTWDELSRVGLHSKVTVRTWVVLPVAYNSDIKAISIRPQH